MVQLKKTKTEVVAKRALEEASKDYIPARVSDFDDLIENHGIERGSTILIAGGCGTGKTTFAMQSLYNGLLHGEKAIYITFEEPPEKILKHSYRNFGWGLEKFRQEGKFAIIKMDPFRIARNVEATLLQKRGDLLIEIEGFQLPFTPDKLAVDSLSALEIAFKGNMENYRVYVMHLFEMLDSYNSVNLVITETELGPDVYTRSGMEEFLADGVVVLYNVRVGSKRERALEIIKLRFSDHVKKLVPFVITSNGIEIPVQKSARDILAEASTQ